MLFVDPTLDPGTATFIATSSDYDALGERPGISDDGRLVAFMGAHKTQGVGIYCAVIGSSKGVISDPFKITGFPGFSAFIEKARVGVGGPVLGSVSKYAVVYLAFGDSGVPGQAGPLGISVSLIDLSNPNAPVIASPSRVARVGDTIAGLADPLQNIALYDPINTYGQTTFWVSTASRQAILRATPTGGTVDLTGSISLIEDGVSVLPGSQKKALVTVLKIGTAIVTDPLRLEIYLSADQTLDAQDIKVGEIPALLLEPGPFTTVRADITLASSPQPGLDRAGLRYLIVKVDSDNSIAETSEENNIGISPVFWMGQVVNIITHGFNPRPPWLSIGGQPWETFRATSYQMADKFNSIPSSGTLLENRMTNYVTAWESSSYFLPAFAAIFAAKLAEAYGICALQDGDVERVQECEDISILLKGFAQHEATSSGPLALNEAARVYREIRTGVLLSDTSLSQRFQRIHLVGHSRGAALNARLSKILAQDGYWVDQYTALDGFSTDWPDDAGLIGDIRIVDEATGTKKVNYRVEAGLDDFIVDAVILDNPVGQEFLQSLLDLTALLNPVANLVRGIYPPACVLDNLRNLDLRAPERKPVLSDIVLEGNGSGLDAYSHHINIQQLYMSSAQNSLPEKQYILQNFVGRNRQARSSLEDANPLPNGFANAGLVNQVAGSEIDSPMVLAQSTDLDQQFSNFRDGGFDELAALWLRATSFGTNPIGDDFIDAWVGIVADPGTVLSALWTVTGDLRLMTNGTNALVKLVATNETSLSQTVLLLPGARSLGFDLLVEESQPGASLNVLQNSNVLQTIGLVARGTNRINLRLNELTGPSDFTFRLAKGTGPPPEVELDNLVVLYARPAVISIALLPDGSVKLQVESETGEIIALEASGDMKQWTTFTTRTNLTGRLDYIDSPPAVPRQRFYRARLP
jgi:hypothetical protein